MIGIEMSGVLAATIGVLGAVWIYLDGRDRNLETADMYAVGFFVGMFVPPIVGAAVVGTLYLQRRKGNRGNPATVPRLS